jgi:hypothetical protein
MYNRRMTFGGAVKAHLHITPVPAYEIGIIPGPDYCIFLSGHIGLDLGGIVV